MDEVNHLCFYATAFSPEQKALLWQNSWDIWGDFGFFCLPIWHKADFFDKNSENLCRREPQIQLITWHGRSRRQRGLKHYRHFNSVLCNNHQHRPRANQFPYNCPKMSFLAAIIPHGSQSKRSHRQRWRLLTPARSTFITIDFWFLFAAVPFLYTLMIWIHQILLQLLDECRWYLFIPEAPTLFLAQRLRIDPVFHLCCRLTAAWYVKFSVWLFDCLFDCAVCFYLQSPGTFWRLNRKRLMEFHDKSLKNVLSQPRFGESLTVCFCK